MFGKKKLPPINSLVAQGSRIEGHYFFSEGLRIVGELVGDIRAQGQQPQPHRRAAKQLKRRHLS